jgi:hypothetical protein
VRCATAASIPLALIRSQSSQSCGRTETLYSSGIFDLDAGPVTVTMPETGGLFMSMKVINQDHYVVGNVLYGAGRRTFAPWTIAAMRTRRDIDLDQCLAVVTWTARLRARQRGQRAMRYVGNRDVDFVVFHSSGAWKYIVGGETRGALRAGASLVDLDRILQGMDLQNSLRSDRPACARRSAHSGCRPYSCRRSLDALSISSIRLPSHRTTARS